jgi:hypothetical protein
MIQLKWIDKKSVLKVGKQLFKAGDILPADELSEKRIELFISLKQIEKVVESPKEEKPKGKPRKKRATTGPKENKPEDVENDSSEG